MSAGPRIAILTEDPGWHEAELRRALEERKAQVQFMRLGECRLDFSKGGHGIVLPGFEDRLPDGVMVRDVPGGTLEQVVLRLDILHALHELEVPVYNTGRSIERTVDKAMTSFLLHTAGLPMPPTCVAEAAAPAHDFLLGELSAGYEVVAKPLFGSLGVGLRRLSREGDLPGPSEFRGVWYLQRYVDTGSGGSDWHDWRVLVIGGVGMAAMVRRGASWINNVAQGARCEPAALGGELERLAVDACAAVGADYAGVDLVRDRDGQLQVLEVNGIPAWKGLQSVTGTDIAGRVAEDFLFRRVTSENVAEV
jgi:tetrahydromethanopterin:alpha-L-glutamate ligase